jgi:hypothetical protein
MNPTKLKNNIAARFNAGIKRPLHIVSSPGLGKTQIAKQAAKELGVACIVVHAPLMQPEDYGFPCISADKSNVNFIVSKEKFPLIGSDCPEKGILVIDELPQTDQSGQKILAQAIQEFEIHGKHFKPGWMIITTGNKSTDRAGASRLLSHLQNRVTEVELEASLDDWTQWALSNGVKTEVIAFIRFRPELLNQFNSQNTVNPTSRSWTEGVSAALGVIPADSEFESFKGDVGEGPAAEICGFLGIYRKLPSVDMILLNPSTTHVPAIGSDENASATLYAICGALSNRASKDNFGTMMEYVKRIPPEFGVLFVKMAIKKSPVIQESSEFIKWVSGEGGKLLA